jgi:hypothetical protein
VLCVRVLYIRVRGVRRQITDVLPGRWWCTDCKPLVTEAHPVGSLYANCFLGVILSPSPRGGARGERGNGRYYVQRTPYGDAESVRGRRPRPPRYGNS